jgi:ketosteroid isomerase-like protein
MNLTLSAIYFILAGALASAQEPSVLSDDRMEDKRALRELAASYEAAINRGDLTSLQDSLLPEASAVFVTGDECRGLPAMQAFYDGIKAKLGAGSRYTVKLNPDTTDFYGDVAVGHGTSDEQVTFASGGTLAYQSKWTAVLQKQNGQWQASRLHVSLDPISNPIVAARTSMEGWLKLGAGGLGGLFVGFLAGKRRKTGQGHPVPPAGT